MKDGQLDKEKGLFGQNPSATMITTTYDPVSKNFLSGTGKGHIYHWSGRTCTKCEEAHQGAVMGLQAAAGVVLTSGSKDNKIKLWKDGVCTK